MLESRESQQAEPQRMMWKPTLRARGVQVAMQRTEMIIERALSI